MATYLSEAAERLQGQPMFKVLSKIKERERAGEKIIHFEIGDPDFGTPENIVNAANAALRGGFTHYADSMGDFDFRKVIAERTNKTRGFMPDIEQVLVAPGANILIYYAIACLVNPGEEVIVPSPGFPTYLSAIKYCGAVPVFVPLRRENGLRLSPRDVREAITEKTRLIIVNSPSNPTGAVMLPEELQALGKLAMEKDIYLYSDEIYSRLNYGDTAFYSPSAVDKCRENILVANGFSKAFAMTGWRLGTCIGPAHVIKKMGLLLETTSSCVPPFIQKAGIEAVNGTQEHVHKMTAAYRRRRDILVEGLNQIPGIQCFLSGGAFYAFPDITDTGLSSREFADYALERAGVGLLPGCDFGASGEGFVRLCYAVSEESILEGIRRLKKMVEEL